MGILVKGKVALITGGATGIGRATAIGLAQKGVNVVINYSRSQDAALKTVEDVQALGVSCLAVKADVSKDEEVRALVDKTIANFGRLDYLVNSAGTTEYVDLADLEGLKEEYWDKILNVNVKGVFFSSRAAAPYLRESKGSIVNIASTAGITGLGSSLAYAASKAAVISIGKSLARVLAPEVRVNNVAPGVVLTRWVEGRQQHIEGALEGTLLGRLCEPADVAEVVISLLTSAGMVAGQTIIIDGGKVIN